MYVQPTLANVSAAAANVVVSDDVQQLAQSITNGSDPQSYPIAAFTYVLVHKDTYADLTKAQALADFVYWGLTIGQDAAVRLGYAPLPTNVRHAAIRALAAITVDGQQVIDAPVR
jgi:ABC-type phosphate transport system substrate-binding protein